MSGFFPTDEFIKAWHERDEFMRKAADIKVIPSSPDDVIFMLPQRKADETEEEWAQRSCSFKNVGKPE